MVDDTAGEQICQCAQYERAGIADEHFVFAAEDIVGEERNQRSDKRESKNAVDNITVENEIDTDNGAGEDAKSRRESVNAINEVHGINETYTGED